jgi:AcrR family transcriptional regulator
MPRPKSPELRQALVQRAAALLAQRQPVTAASLVAGSGASSMAVYTYFGGMPGLWGEVRQEGFTRLAAKLAEVPVRTDPVRHLADLGVAYAANALAHPDLYRVMFDAAHDLPDPEAAAAAFTPLVVASGHAQADGRFAQEQDAQDIAMRYWATGHGVTSLAVTGVLSTSELQRHAQAVAVAVFVDAGDSRQKAAASVRAAWRTVTLHHA